MKPSSVSVEVVKSCIKNRSRSVRFGTGTSEIRHRDLRTFVAGIYRLRIQIRHRDEIRHQNRRKFVTGIENNSSPRGPTVYGMEIRRQDPTVSAERKNLDHQYTQVHTHIRVGGARGSTLFRLWGMGTRGLESENSINTYYASHRRM